MSSPPRKPSWQDRLGIRRGGGEGHREDRLDRRQGDRRGGGGRRASDRPTTYYTERGDEPTSAVRQGRSRKPSPLETHPPWKDDPEPDPEDGTSPGKWVGPQGPTFIEMIDAVQQVAEFQAVTNELIAVALHAIKRGSVDRAYYVIPHALIDRLKMRLDRGRDQETRPEFHVPEHLREKP